MFRLLYVACEVVELPVLRTVNAISLNLGKCLAAEIKLLEVWKSVIAEGCPIKLEPYNEQSSQNSHQLRLTLA